MYEQVKVEIAPRTVSADEHTRAQRAGVVEKLNNLGLVANPAAGEVGDDVTAGFTVTVNGSAVQVDGYAIESAPQGGRALVSLLVAADAVQIGVPRHDSRESSVVVPPWSQPAGKAAEKPTNRPGVWGQPAKDPRENIPGWTPEVAR